MTRPSQQEMFAETATLVRSFGWSLDEILDLEHPDRRAWVRAAASSSSSSEVS